MLFLQPFPHMIKIFLLSFSLSIYDCDLSLFCGKFLKNMLYLILVFPFRLVRISNWLGQAGIKSRYSRTETGNRQPATMFRNLVLVVVVVALVLEITVHAGDTNPIFDPCSDAKLQRFDGFTFGFVFSSKDSFSFNQTQLSPCDGRLSLTGSGAESAIFRPKVDEISLLTINRSTLDPSKSGGYMVAFAGRRYAARSSPVFVADNAHTITSFTLVLEFQKGTLQNLFWKKFGCNGCSANSFVCLNNTDCALPNSKCTRNGGSIDCNIGVQLAFSGTDKNDNVLNSWYEVSKLRQYSLYALYSDLRDSVTSPFQNLF